MELRAIRADEFDDAMNVAWYDRMSAYDEAREMQGLWPELFVGGFEGGRLIGVCYGWPVYVHRWRRLDVALQAISMAWDRRGQGRGGPLMAEWEARAKALGIPHVSLGSSADSFYRKHGYRAVEYCLKVHRAYLPDGYTSRDDLTYIGLRDEPFRTLYFRVGEAYDADAYARLREAMGADSACTIFEKRL